MLQRSNSSTDCAEQPKAFLLPFPVTWLWFVLNQKSYPKSQEIQVLYTTIVVSTESTKMAPFEGWGNRGVGGMGSAKDENIEFM